MDDYNRKWCSIDMHSFIKCFLLLSIESLQEKSPFDKTFSRFCWLFYCWLGQLWNYVLDLYLELLLTPILAKNFAIDPYKSWPLKLRPIVLATYVVMRGGGSWGRSRLLLDVATSYSDRGTRGVEMMPLRWRGILGSIEAVLAAPPDMGGICESRDWFWLDGGEKRCCWRWASRWLEPTPFISRSSSSWKKKKLCS